MGMERASTCLSEAQGIRQVSKVEREGESGPRCQGGVIQRGHALPAGRLVNGPRHWAIQIALFNYQNLPER